jgi:hypothetical protein
MSEPLVFVTTHTVNDGRLEAVRELSRRFADHVESSDTGLLAFYFVLTEDGREVSNVQVYADAAAMDEYLPVAQELIGEALTLTETRSVEVFGRPGPLAGQALRHVAEHGAEVTVRPEHLSGFTRALAA